MVPLIWAPFFVVLQNLTNVYTKSCLKIWNVYTKYVSLQCQLVNILCKQSMRGSSLVNYSGSHSENARAKRVRTEYLIYIKKEVQHDTLYFYLGSCRPDGRHYP